MDSEISNRPFDTDGGVNPELIKDFETKFQTPMNIMARNTVVNVGSEFASMDSDVKITHTFVNTLKKHHLKATNQSHSGRCWLFAGMNVFRHLIIRSLGLEGFEFSEVYLFFWDKFERANYFLQWWIDHPQCDLSSREAQYVLDDYRSDGGYWDMFANLVKKYGLIPKDAMPETFQSGDSNDMNDVLKDQLDSFVVWILKNPDSEDKDNMKTKTLNQVYDTLVKFLGQPPKKFTWNFVQEDEHQAASMITDPLQFTNMVLPHPELDIDDFVMLTNFPTEKCKLNQMYEVQYTSNMVGRPDTKFLNLHISELKKYTLKSILAGVPVWFAGDVRKGFSVNHSALNTKVFNTDLLFGKTLEMSKGDKMETRNSQANHAMVLLGVNVDEKGKPIEWQVENSWGYYDPAEPGFDGFLSASDSWFDEYLFEVVIHKKFLSRNIRKMLEQKPITLDPWESVAPAARVGPMRPPTGYLERLGEFRDGRSAKRMRKF